MGVYVGMDIGGTKLAAAAGNADLEIIRSSRYPTPSQVVEGLELIDSMISEVSANETIDGIGVAVGGPLDWKSGVVSPVHQPLWRDVALRDRLEQRWDCPVMLDVDANIAAVGEFVAGRYDQSRFLYLTLSTGMGGGFLIDGEIYRGGHGDTHPEVGHQSIAFRCSHPDRVHCDCGAPDCLEGLICGTAIRRIYGKPAEDLGDEEWEEVAYNLGQGLRNIAVVYAPDIIVLGGGVAHGRGEKLLAPARRLMQERMKLVPPPEVRLSCLGYGTALFGTLVAARLAARQSTLPTAAFALSDEA